MDRAGRLRNKVAPLLAASGLAAALSASDGGLIVWRLEGDRVVADVGAPAAPLPVGSLQKPFVAKAWARAHPTLVPEPFKCDPRSGCWLRSGHGLLNVTRATAVSCNAYFRRLAEETPEVDLVATLRGEGFVVGERVSPDAAIGLEGGGVTISPATLLEAYRRLTREPWTTGEPVRRLVLSGLRDAALSGTAHGLARRGYWAKTGTSAAIDGRPLATSGWAVAVDDSGWGVLGLLPEGTGREAAVELAAPLSRLRPWATPIGRDARDVEGRATAPGAPPVTGSVRVSLFEALGPARVTVRNCGGSPAAGSRGYVGAGATVDLKAGERLGTALWELSIPERHVVRRVRGALSCQGGPGATLRVIADLEPREYVDGVLAAELPEGRPLLRDNLAPAVLRFLSAGPRHEDADVCDTTHCAWFVGRGPRLTWHGETATLVPRRGASGAPALLDDAAWARALAAAREPGPAFWTGHCGGAPLSPHAVWGNGDRRVASCPRHTGGASRPWSRAWSEAEVAAAFGEAVDDLSVEWPDGVWTLVVRAGGSSRPWRYDEAHRALAAALGWGALPSPATRVARASGGWKAEGFGLGHRVGLCLADEGHAFAMR